VDIEARGAQGGGVRYWLRSLASQILVGPSGTEIEDRDAPAVLVRAATGKETVLLRTGTIGQARRAAARYSNESAQLGAQEFCNKYGLPPEIVP